MFGFPVTSTGLRIRRRECYTSQTLEDGTLSKMLVCRPASAPVEERSLYLARFCCRFPKIQDIKCNKMSKT